MVFHNFFNINWKNIRKVFLFRLSCQVSHSWLYTPGDFVAFESLKAEKAQEIDVKVFEATFENRIEAHMYVYQPIYGGFKLVFDTDQHPEVRLTENDSFL